MRCRTPWLRFYAARALLGWWSVNSSIHGQTAAPVPAADPAPLPKLEIIDPTAAQFERANAFFQAQRYVEALKEFSDALPKLSDSRKEESLFRIADCYRLLGKSDDALAVYDLLAQSYPDSVFSSVVKFRRGELLFRAENFALALAAFQDCQSKADDVTKQAARFFAALCQMKLEPKDDAIDTLRGFADVKLPTPYALAAAQTLAEYFEKNQQWAEAQRYWQNTLTFSLEKPAQVQAAARGGWVALQNKDAKEAERLFGVSRQLDPASAWVKLAQTGLLEIYYQQNRDQELLDLFNKNRDGFLAGSRAEVLFDVAHATFRLQDWPGAARAYDVFLTQNKDHLLAPLAAYERLRARLQMDRENLRGDATAFLAAYPQSEFVPAVLFLRAQDFSARRQFAEARPLWEQLGKDQPEGLPKETILWELARARFELKDWLAAAEGFGDFAQKFPKSEFALSAWTNRAVAFQNIPDLEKALSAWQDAKGAAAAHTKERQTALEQSALILSQLNRPAEAVAAYRVLLADFPQSNLRALAAYTTGADSFDQKKYRDAEPLLKSAREWEAKTWFVPATYRLAWIAYQKREVEKTATLLREYDAAITGNAKAVRLPAAFYYWLGIASNQAGKTVDAARYFAQVTEHPESGELLSSAWWELAEDQRKLKQWADAVKSYQIFRQREVKTADSSVILLALAEAQTQSGLFPAAQLNLEKVLLQEPEGPLNAQARFLQAQWHLAQKNYVEAARTFATLSLIYRDDILTPQAMQGAADAWALAKDDVQAAAWREKLQNQYPDYVEKMRRSGS